MSYNATEVLNNFTGNGSASLYKFTQITNQTLLGGWLGIFIWLMLVGVIFGSMKARGITTSGAFSACTFFGFIITLFLISLNLVPNWFLYINIVALAIVGIVLVMNRE